MISQAQIDQVVAVIVHSTQPEKVVLFGSYAGNNPNEDSDLDLLIIKDTKIERTKRGREIRKYLRGLKIPVDLVVYTPHEVKEWAGTKSAFVTHVLESGKVLYG